MDVSLVPEAKPTVRPPRFERIAVSSVFGDPRALRTWSGAPANIASALERLGVTVESVQPRIGKVDKARLALAGLLAGHGWPLNSEQILRGMPARRLHAAQVAAQAATLGVRQVLHFGTFDLPASDAAEVEHYLYCDHTWALSRLHHVHAQRYTAKAMLAFEAAERQSLQHLAHVFTFGAYVRDNLIAHYGLAPGQVTAVGSGFGAIEPYAGPKDYRRPHLLFVAKHLFQAKGGVLLLRAFAEARKTRQDLQLTIVGDERSRRYVPDVGGIDFRAHLPWEELQELYRRSTLLVQPMLNDPWGQVYLEAMASRTPVMGLARNGLPELVDGGRHGFLVDRADPVALAQAIVCALSDPGRLERIAAAGQRYVLGTHSWDRAAERMLFN